MASTYALPVDSSNQTFSHGHSRSHYVADSHPPWGQMNGHDRHHSAMNGQLHAHDISPYGDSHGHTHENGHDHSRSKDSTFTLKPLMGGRPRGRPRGESDLGRPRTQQSAAPSKFAFSPIEEAPPPLPSSWLELPEALTALLIPLPYLFASLAYPSIIAQSRRLPTLQSIPESLLQTAPTDPTTETLPDGAQFLHACTLSSATLILIGIFSKILSMADQPLDRRKSCRSSDQLGERFDVLRHSSAVPRIVRNIVGIMLPFYATMQLGGARTALFLLAAVTAGLGSLEQKPGKHTLWDGIKRSLRTRKATCAILALGMLLDVSTCLSRRGATLGYMALYASVLAVPPPLPTTGWFLATGKGNGASARLSLPKPSSQLINTSEDTLLTLTAGGLLTIFTVLFSIVSSSSPSIAHHAIFFSTLSVASATALVFFSLPAALRTRNKIGLALGSVLTTSFGIYEHSDSWQSRGLFPLMCILVFGAVSFDLGLPSLGPHSHSNSQSHNGQKHSHSHDHHLHGNHSKLSAFLIGRCSPGSIAHSIMIEKDSRRIAYFGMLNLAFMLVQFFYGFVSGSLGLLTDSIHMLFDCAGLAVGLAAAVMSKWRPNTRFPYGYGKIDTLSGFANGVFLMLVSVEICFDAFERLWEGHELQRLNELLLVSILGFLVNIVGLTAFGHAHHGHGHSHDHDHGHHGHHHHDNENMQGIFLHILADALGSVAVIISTLLTKSYGWSGWDPIASCMIAILIFISAVPLVKSSGMRLLLSLPADVEYGIRNTLQELSSLRGIVGYAVPKFWLEDEGAAHSEVHAKEYDNCGPSHNHVHLLSRDQHSHDAHDNGSNHTHDDSHDHALGHSHDHTLSGSLSHPHGHGHDHDHDHDHDHSSAQQKILGVIHIIASRGANLEDVRDRTTQFLKDRGMDVILHVDSEGDGRCWCGGSNKMN